MSNINYPEHILEPVLNSHIRSVDLALSDEKDLGAHLGFLIEKASHIEEVTLSDYVEDAHVALLSGFPHLTSLTLYNGYSLTGKGLRALCSLKKLKRLSFVGHCGIENDPLYTELGRLSQLKELQLREWEYVDDELLSQIAFLKDLEALDLGASFTNNYLTDKGLKNLEPLQKLRFLDLSIFGRITDQGLKSIAKLKKLEILKLSNCPLIGDGGLKELGGLEHLESLDLSHCKKVTDQGLFFLRSLKNLKHVLLDGCPQVSAEERTLFRP